MYLFGLHRKELKRSFLLQKVSGKMIEHTNNAAEIMFSLFIASVQGSEAVSNHRRSASLEGRFKKKVRLWRKGKLEFTLGLAI